MPLNTTLDVCSDAANPLTVSVGPTAATGTLGGTPTINLPPVAGSLKLSPVAVALPTIVLAVAPQLLNLLVLLLSGAPGLLEKLIDKAGDIWGDIEGGLKDAVGGAVDAVGDTFKNAVRFSAPGPAGGTVGLATAPSGRGALASERPAEVDQVSSDAVAHAAAILLPLISIKMGTVKISALPEGRGVIAPTVNFNLDAMPVRVDLDQIQLSTRVEAFTKSMSGCVEVEASTNGILP